MPRHTGSVPGRLERRLLPLLGREGGAIVNVSSVAAVFGGASALAYIGALPDSVLWHSSVDALGMQRIVIDSGKINAAMAHNLIRGYRACVSFMDAQLGRILSTLQACGLQDQTTLIYASDHGDNLGTRGMWGKSTMFATRRTLFFEGY